MFRGTGRTGCGRRPAQDRPRREAPKRRRFAEMELWLPRGLGRCCCEQPRQGFQLPNPGQIPDIALDQGVPPANSASSIYRPNESFTLGHLKETVSRG